MRGVLIKLAGKDFDFAAHALPSNDLPIAREPPRSREQPQVHYQQQPSQYSQHGAQVPQAREACTDLPSSCCLWDLMKSD